MRKSFFHNLSTPKLITFMTIVYALTYLLVGGLAYYLFTKQLYVGDHALFTAYLRSEADQQLWQHVNTWQIPLLLIRSLLIAVVLYPFFGALKHMGYKKSFFTLFGLFFILTHLAAGAPSPGNMEGVVYMRPQLINPTVFLLVQPEMLFQSAFAAAGFSYLIKNWSDK